MERRKTRQIHAGTLLIGGNAPVSIQSMTNIPTVDTQGNIEQIKRLEQAGCDLVRITVPNEEAAASFGKIKQAVKIPLSADIHFDYKMAIAAIEAGADKIRINPGNIGSEERVRAVASACAERGIPIRVGVNSGSVRRDILEKYGGPTVQALLDCAMENIRALEKCGFYDICLSIKASDVSRTIQANMEAAKIFPYPLHIGVTEAGAGEKAVLRSGIGIGALLSMGIGDTIRVSLTGDPVAEVYAAKRILDACGLNEKGINIVSCPTCGRTAVDLVKVVAELEKKTERIQSKRRINVAVMGCVVNGPGEAREADIGIAGGINEFLLFEKGEPIGKIPAELAVDILTDKIKTLAQE